MEASRNLQFCQRGMWHGARRLAEPSAAIQSEQQCVRQPAAGKDQASCPLHAGLEGFKLRQKKELTQVTGQAAHWETGLVTDRAKPNMQRSVLNGYRVACEDHPNTFQGALANRSTALSGDTNRSKPPSTVCLQASEVSNVL